MFSDLQSTSGAHEHWIPRETARRGEKRNRTSMTLFENLADRGSAEASSPTSVVPVA